MTIMATKRSSWGKATNEGRRRSSTQQTTKVTSGRKSLAVFSATSSYADSASLSASEKFELLDGESSSFYDASSKGGTAGDAAVANAISAGTASIASFRSSNDDDDKLMTSSVVSGSRDFSSVVSNPEFPSLVQRSKRFHFETCTKDFTINKVQFRTDQLYGHKEAKSTFTNSIKGILSSSSSTSTTPSIPEVERMGGVQNRRQLILVSGESGVGKTSLVQQVTLQEQTFATAKAKPATVMFGAFDGLSRGHKPYAGIAEAVGELCGKILALTYNPETVSQYVDFCDSLVSELQGEMEILCTIMPVLEEVIGQEFNVDTTTNIADLFDASVISNDGDNHTEATPALSVGHRQENNVKEERKHQFNYAFLKFSRVVAAHFPKLIWILDDLQWADEASLKLIESLLTDDKNSKDVTIVGTYRSEDDLLGDKSNAQGENNVLKKTITTWKEKQEKGKLLFDITEIKLENLGVSDVNEMLQDVLKMDEEAVSGLSKICHQKTSGNPFFLKEYVKFLNEKQLLDYNIGAMKWIWDEPTIVRATEATENVLDVMKLSVNGIPDEVRDILNLAACLGPSFSNATLKLVWEEYQPVKANYDLQERAPDKKAMQSQHSVGDKATPLIQVSSGKPPIRASKMSLKECLTIADNKGFLIQDHDNQNTLRWVHSKLLEAVLLCIPGDEQRLMKFQVGNILLSKLDKVKLDGMVFVVANLLNEGSEHSMTKEIVNEMNLAQLNLRASEKAIRMAAFELATKYATKGVSYLPEDRWTRHYPFTLHMYTLLVEVECVCGKFDTMERHCQEILSQEGRPLNDMAPAYYVMVQRRLMESNIDEGMELCLDVLRKLGCKFPKSKVALGWTAVTGIIKLKKTAKFRTIDEINELPFLDDPINFQVMKLLEKLTALAYFKKDPVLLPAILRAYRLTLKQGISFLAPIFFSNIAVMLGGFLSDFHNTKVYAEYSLAMMEKIGDRNILPRLHVSAWAGALHYVNPIHCILKPMQEGYEIGMATGDFPRALHCLNLYLQAAMVAGRPLLALENECRMFIRQMEEFAQNFYASFSSYLWQMVLNLIGRSENTTILTGEAMDEETVDFKSDVHKAYFNTFKIQLLVWFGEYEKAAAHAISDETIMKASPGCCLAYSDNFFRGIALFHMARKTRSSKYKKHAKGILTRAKQWVEKGNPNVRHHAALLEAEMAALRGRREKAMKQYKSAIFLASRQGFIQDAATSYERYGEYLLNVVLDEEDAMYQLNQAVKLYTEWGAHSKANNLQEKYAAFWAVPVDIDPETISELF